MFAVVVSVLIQQAEYWFYSICKTQQFRSKIDIKNTQNKDLKNRITFAVTTNQKKINGETKILL